jgi:hypothetical protein
MRARLRQLPLALGCFAVVLAVLLPTFVYPRLARLPADPRQTQALTARGATALVPDTSSPAGARVVENAQVRITTYVSGAPGELAYDGSVVWRLATTTRVQGFGVVDARVETLSLDPHTAAPTNCCGDALVTDISKPNGTPVHHRGYVAWPFDVRKRAYQVWDGQLNRATTAAFIGEEKRQGIATYRFEVVTPMERTGTRELPGWLFGRFKPSVDAVAEYQDLRTYWVEPATGSVVELRDRVRQQFRYEDTVVPAMDADLRSAPLDPALREQIERGALVLPLLRWRASLFLLLDALLALAFWARRYRRSRQPSAGGPAGAAAVARATAAAWRPDRRPKKEASPSWVPDAYPRPSTAMFDAQAPAAYTPGTAVPSGRSTRPSTSTRRPPQLKPE